MVCIMMFVSTSKHCLTNIIIYQVLRHGVDPSWVPISPVVARWEDQSGNQLSCEQLPLTLAWAITIHKSQGLTLDCAIIDLGPKDFSSGLSFVAISQVKKLKGQPFVSPLESNTYSVVKKQSQ